MKYSEMTESGKAAFRSGAIQAVVGTIGGILLGLWLASVT